MFAPTCGSAVWLTFAQPACGGEGAHVCICRMVLESPRFEDFFQMVEVPNFEIASDAFQTFKVQT